MAFTKSQIVSALKLRSPVGVEVPRDPATNETDTDTIERWARDGTQKINERLSRTTTKETTIELVADQEDYELPADCREVITVIREHEGAVRVGEILGVPTQMVPLGLHPGGFLPSGQEITASIDLIGRQRLARERREDDFELIGGKIRFLFPITAGEKVVIRYRSVDRDYTAITDDRFETLMLYVQIQNLSVYLSRNSISIVQDGARFGQDSLAMLTRQKLDLERAWLQALNSIGPEAGVVTPP